MSKAPVPGTTIHAKMLAISEELGFIEFDAKNTGQNYKYASAAGVLRKLQMALIKNRVTRVCVLRQDTFVPGEDNKSNLVVTNSQWVYTCCDTGETVRTCGYGSGKDSNDKFAMKAATADNKYEIAHTFCLGWGAEDPENDSSSKGSSSPSKASKASAAVSVADIQGAASMEALEALRGGVAAAKGAAKEKLVAAYKAKKNELTA